MPSSSLPSSRVATLVLLVSIVLVGLIGLGCPSDALACGAFVGPPLSENDRFFGKQLEETLPTVQVERVLLVWDKETGNEDLIRETSFQPRPDKAFGFVVPIPTKPELVTAVKKSPFDALQKAFPFDAPDAGAAGSNRDLTVLSTKRIGSFTATILSATDAAALAGWLTDTGLAMPEQSASWVAHYVALKFFFVAFRYSPPPSDKDAGVPLSMTSETMRIRFKTPNPYYPYMEPKRREATRGAFVGWLVTPEPMDAVAKAKPAKIFADGETFTWWRPWSAGMAYRTTAGELAKHVGPELEGVLRASGQSSGQSGQGLVVQALEDRNIYRKDFGDVLLVPSTPQTFTKEDEEARRFLLPVVNPSLLDADVDAGDPVRVTTTPTASPSSQRSKGCGGAAPVQWSSASSTLTALAVASAIVLRRRRSARNKRRPIMNAIVLLLVSMHVIACHRSSSSESDPAAQQQKPLAKSSSSLSSPDPSSVALPNREERERVALAILEGRAPAPGIGPYQKPEVPIPVSRPLEGAATRGNVVPGETKFDVPIADGNRIIAGLRARFRRCYGAALDLDPTMHGEIVITAEVATNGEVTSVKVSKNDGMSSAAATCCADVLRRTQFDPPEGGKRSKVVLPLTFKPIEPK